MRRGKRIRGRANKPLLFFISYPQFYTLDIFICVIINWHWWYNIFRKSLKLNIGEPKNENKKINTSSG